MCENPERFSRNGLVSSYEAIFTGEVETPSRNDGQAFSTTLVRVSFYPTYPT
jgi:hypothetical protein